MWPIVQSAASVSLLMIQNWEELLVQWVAVLPFRVISTGWRKEEYRGTSWSFTKASTKSCCGGIIPCNSSGWRLTVWKAALQRRTWEFWHTASCPWASSVPFWRKRPVVSYSALGKALPSVWEGWFFPSTQPHIWSPRSPSDGSLVWSSQILHCSFIGRMMVVLAPAWPQDVFYGEKSSVFMPIHRGPLV